MYPHNYPTLFSGTKLGNVTIKNRIMSSAHQTTLVENHLPTDDFIAYHTERAKGGVGLIVMEAHGVHQTGLNTPFAIDASNPEIINIHKQTAKNVHKYGAKLFAQLIHHGREAYISEDNDDVVAPSAVPTERFHIIPRVLEDEEIEEIIDGFVQSALHLQEAGLDGVEFAGSHAYLFEQFWSAKVNKRNDKWGGSFENRMRFTREVIRRVREAVGEDFVLGMRMSLDSIDEVGTSGEDSIKIIQHLQELEILDYWSMVIGSSATYKGSSYIVPPSTDSAYELFEGIPRMKEVVNDTPIIITSRIYTPEIAEDLMHKYEVDVVGMTRALIADPHFPNKILEGKDEQIIPCIACNQGCIGRYQEHLPIRCTVNPITGREKHYANYVQEKSDKSFIVVGGGPSGMMTAITLAKASDDVTLYESSNTLGGQLNVMKGSLHSEQVDDWLKYLKSEIKRLGVHVKLNQTVTIEEVKQQEPNAVVVASGAKPLMPDFVSDTNINVYSAWDVLAGNPIQEKDVVVIDWKGDWPGVEATQLLASQGKQVEIISQTYAVGESLQQYRQNKALEEMDRLHVKQTPNFKLADMDDSTITIEHLFSGRQESRTPEAIVLSVGLDATESLEKFHKLSEHVEGIARIGDAKSPRSLDEAVYEGFKTALELSK